MLNFSRDQFPNLPGGFIKIIILHGVDNLVSSMLKYALGIWLVSMFIGICDGSVQADIGVIGLAVMVNISLTFQQVLFIDL